MITNNGLVEKAKDSLNLGKKMLLTAGIAALASYATHSNANIVLNVGDSHLEMGRTYDGIALSDNGSQKQIHAFDDGVLDFYNQSNISSGIQLSGGAQSTVTDSASFGGDRVYEFNGSQITITDTAGNNLDSIGATGYDCGGSFEIGGNQYLSILNSRNGDYGYIDLSDNSLTRMGSFGSIGTVKGMDSYAKPGATSVEDVVFGLCGANGFSQYDAKTGSWIADENVTINGITGGLSDIYFENDGSGNITTFYSTDGGFRGEVGVTDGTFKAIPEPTALSLIAGAGVGLLALRRLRF